MNVNLDQFCFMFFTETFESNHSVFDVLKVFFRNGWFSFWFASTSLEILGFPLVCTKIPLEILGFVLNFIGFLRFAKGFH